MLSQGKTNQHSRNGLHSTGHYNIIHIGETLSVTKAARHCLVVDDESNKHLICGYALLINDSQAILVSEQT
ncbi:hypothetical protein CY34DRAFT_650119 [Suillus luteus UH-Slu-Lm8-n1]|uniref:Uncharacterized protein n=1 Tax=Suillus luteus UH-Slu-Lm8-n1 TaxID=930992 RepID=A0A0D0B2A1_9AGAM|nr:hypothetical protein CY34DRAFT_650119 [Suillus luteus UH-Slu-Lm8-n1]